MTAPDPFDVGALLTAAVDAYLAAHPGQRHADVARLVDMPHQNLGRALRSPDTRAPVARRILAALGHHVEVAADGGGLAR